MARNWTPKRKKCDSRSRPQTVNNQIDTKNNPKSNHKPVQQYDCLRWAISSITGGTCSESSSATPDSNSTLSCNPSSSVFTNLRTTLQNAPALTQLDFGSLTRQDTFDPGKKETINERPTHTYMQLVHLVVINSLECVFGSMTSKCC